MTTDQIIREAKALLDEKGLTADPESIQLLVGVSQTLAQRGIASTRELLDFTIDVVRAKTLAGLPAEAEDDDWGPGKETLIEWLEAMGWRRDWFTRPLTGAH